MVNAVLATFLVVLIIKFFMIMFRRYALIAALTVAGASAVQAQEATLVLDNFDVLMQRAKATNPNFDADMAAMNASIAERAKALEGTSAKGTAMAPVPVIFHIVITDAQQKNLGGLAGIQDRIITQLEALNEDFQGMNADSSTIPVAFKPLYSKLGLRFELAQKDPNGNYTPGYEIITTTKTSFSAQVGTVSDVKKASTGGADIWDPEKYYNIWVTNIIPLGVGGMGTPPPYPAYGGQFPVEEQGVVIAHLAWGKKTAISTKFLTPDVVLGRTLVHETGHFMNLFHPFGISTMDNSSCTDDDGVGDTPPQAKPTQSVCLTFPATDVCSPNSPGIMFMNHMDYSSEKCRTMFSKDQVARMGVELQSGGYRYELTQHPELTQIAASVGSVDNAKLFSVFPNPASGTCYVAIDKQQSHKLKEVILTNSFGQVVRRVNELNDNGISLDGITPGIYSVSCVFTDGTATKRLVVNR